MANTFLVTSNFARPPHCFKTSLQRRKETRVSLDSFRFSVMFFVTHCLHTHCHQLRMRGALFDARPTMDNIRHYLRKKHYTYFPLGRTDLRALTPMFASLNVLLHSLHLNSVSAVDGPSQFLNSFIASQSLLNLHTPFFSRIPSEKLAI